MSIATSPVQIGRQPSLLTLTDTAMGKVAELLADEEVADTLACGLPCAGWVLGLQL